MMMLYVKAFHMIAVVAWFAGLFYLPRLYVYHTTTSDEVGYLRFQIMERRLYYGIMWPAGLAVTALGIALIGFNPGYYLHARWLHIKLGFVILVWVYHLFCGHYLKQFASKQNPHGCFFYRVFNELPLLLLTAIVLLVVVKSPH